MNKDKINILIIDDIETNIYSLKAIICNDDIQIYEALNANIALGIILKNSIDLILCDIQMPEIDGFEFAKLLQTNIKTKEIPIIFITAIYNNEEYQSKGYNLGAIDYITKPINSEILYSKLFKYMQIFKSRKKLEEQNRYIKRIIEASDEANLIIDSTFNIIDFNNKLKSIFFDIKTNINFLNYLENQKVNVLEELKKYLLKCRDSSELVFSLILEYEKKYYKITFKNIEPNFIVIFYDITELENKNKLLISHSRQAAMGEMMSIIAHQWRQPLTTISTILSKIQVKQELELLTKIDLDNNIKNITSVLFI